MPTLYLSETGIKAGVEGDTFRLTNPDGTRTMIPIRSITGVVVFMGAQLSSQMIAELLVRDIPTTFISNNGRYFGRLLSTETSNIELRVKQYDRLNDLKFRSHIAVELIKGKLLNSAYLLKNLNRVRKIALVTERIDDLYRRLRNLNEQGSLDHLRGIEGAAAAHYFESLPLLLKHRFGFSKRNRRPPLDPLNSMLSFAYTLLLYAVTNAISVVGLDPGLGCLHEYTNHRPALPLDLMEPFRPLIADQVIIDMVNHNMVAQENFYICAEAPYPVLIQNNLRKKIISRFEKRLNQVVLDNGENRSYRRILEVQARRYAKSLISSKSFKPFIQQ